MKNADMPAMPSDVKAVYEAMVDSDDSWGKAALGLTKREMMAMHIASGFAADKEPAKVESEAKKSDEPDVSEELLQ